MHPLESFGRLLECAEQDCPPGPDDAFRFQWFGLFYQGPRQDAFTLRLRLPGGRLRAFQLATLAEITQEHAGGQVAFNPAGGLDIPGVPVRAAVEILRRIEGVGLSARQTGGDCVRSVRGGEHCGRAAASYPAVCALEQALAHSRILADLPRPCEIVFAEADEAVAADAERLVLQAVAEPTFLVRLPGQEGGWLTRQPVTACLQLLGAWATRADRTVRGPGGLGAFLGTLAPEEIGELLGVTQPRPAPPRMGSGRTPTPASVPVPGERLLSGQLAALARAAQREGLREICLADGCLYPVPMEGNPAAGGEALALALA